MNPIVFALRHPVTVMVALVGLLVGGLFAVQRMKVDIFPALNLPVIYVAQPYGGLDPAQMEGLITNYYEYHFLYIGGIHHVESKNVQGTALMKLYLPPRHRHGPGDGRNHRPGQSRPRLHAGRHRAAVRHPLRHRQRSGRLPGLLQRDEDPGRNPEPGSVQGAADVRQPARRVGAAAVRRQPAHHRRRGRSRPSALLQPLPRRRGVRPDPGQRHQPVRQRARQRQHAGGADQLDGQGPEGAGEHPAAPGARTSTCATSPPSPTPPTYPPATRWSTAGGRSTSSSPSAPTPRRSAWSTRSKRTSPSSRRSFRRTSTCASSSTSRLTSRAPCRTSPSRRCSARC